MIGKYEFDKSVIEKVLKYFEPAFSTILVWIDYIKKTFRKNKIEFPYYEDIETKIKTIKYLDEFQEIKDMFLNSYELVQLYLLELDVQNINYDVDIIKPKISSLRESVLLTDEIVKYCNDFYKLNNKIPNYNELCVYFLNKLKKYSEIIYFYKSKMDNILDKQQNEIILNLQNLKDIKKWEQGLDLIIGIYDELYLETKGAENIFMDGVKSFWKVYNIFIQMQTICEIAINIEIYLQNELDT
ncbi:hypothetical protein SHELI_v1c05210 [Spiroplasma helicoides]|uniref:Uncharacterized protein n=1 Tax=Spiroplasma helicoides TaxID=216938 RepID=A0A1B3SKL2_9MOLU|nr:hypothetical protein [Spiroplasma helicoides]AOG60472.1 hypothetical protein SHELI_v1c05210 [Spiroplasma helicoides]